MAVVKVSFTKRRGAAKAHLRYITHRPGKGNERTTRVLFGRDGAEAASGLSEQAVPLRTAQEIMQLGDTEVIGFHRSLPPFPAKRIDWRNFPDLTRRRALPAPGVPALPPIPDPPVSPVGESLSFVDPDPAGAG